VACDILSNPDPYTHASLFSAVVYVTTEKEQVGDSYSYPAGLCLEEMWSILVNPDVRFIQRGLTAEVHAYFGAKFGYAKVLYKSTSQN